MLHIQNTAVTTVPSALAHALAISSSKGSPVILHSLPHFLPTYSANTANASLFNVRLCFFVNIRNATGLKCDNSICTGKNVAGEPCRWRFKIDEGTGWNGSELGGAGVVSGPL